MPEVVCVKASLRLDGWVREAYFGQVLDGHERAIQVYDAFSMHLEGAPVLYCLALEYAAAATSGRSSAARAAAGRRRRPAARSRAFSRCCGSCTAAISFTAT